MPFVLIRHPVGPSCFVFPVLFWPQCLLPVTSYSFLANPFLVFCPPASSPNCMFADFSIIVSLYLCLFFIEPLDFLSSHVSFRVLMLRPLLYLFVALFPLPCVDDAHILFFLRYPFLFHPYSFHPRRRTSPAPPRDVGGPSSSVFFRSDPHPLWFCFRAPPSTFSMFFFFLFPFPFQSLSVHLNATPVLEVPPQVTLFPESAVLASRFSPLQTSPPLFSPLCFFLFRLGQDASLWLCSSLFFFSPFFNCLRLATSLP